MSRALIMRFKELRDYISIIDRVSICTQETLCYENFTHSIDIPHTYDDLYVYGIGRIQSEFLIDEYTSSVDIRKNAINEKYFLAECIEIILSKEPRVVSDDNMILESAGAGE